MKTLADAWAAHAAATLPADASAATVRQAKRDYYHAELLRLKALPETAQTLALIAEALGFARTIGRAEETATS